MSCPGGAGSISRLQGRRSRAPKGRPVLEVTSGPAAAAAIVVPRPRPLRAKRGFAGAPVRKERRVGGLSVRGPPSLCQGRGAHRARVCRGLPPPPRPRAGFHPGVSAFPPLIDRTPLGLGPTLATALNVSRLFTNPASKHAVLESWGCGPRPLRLAVSALAVMTETLGDSLGTRHRARASPAGQRPEEDEGRRRWTHRRSHGGVRPARLRLEGRGRRRELRGPVVHAMSRR